MPGYEFFGEEEVDAIVRLLRQNGGIIVAHGFDQYRNGLYKVREFEQTFAQWVGISHVQAVSSGSAALKIALLALGILPGDEVVTQAFTFVATIEAIIEVGAVPIIVDIDDSLGMDPEAFRAAITPKTKAVIPVHMMGEPVDMDPILSIALEHNIAVVEDAAQAMGATYKARKVGTLGTIAAFSTDGFKMLNTGEGGLVATNSKELFAKARSAHDHGHEYSDTLSRAEERAMGRGFNYRLTELHAVIGLIQLAKLDTIISRHRANKRRLSEHLRQLPITFRRSPDADGDTGDALVIYLETQQQARAFASAAMAEKLPIKILPAALKWHFAENWNHLFSDHPLYGKKRSHWVRSHDILSRAVAVPILANLDMDRIDHLGERLRSIANGVLAT